MKIDWESKKSYVLANPKNPAREEIEELLLSTGLKGHIWISTSGSSCSKWVALSKEALLCSAEVVNQVVEVGQQDIYIHPIPDFHVGGLSIWARAHLSGAQVVDFKAQSKWDPFHFKQCAKETGATLTSLVPTQVYDLVSKQIEAPGTLRVVFVGGGALEENLYEKASLLGWKLLPTYGSTETSSQVATAPLQGPPFLHLLPHMQARVDPEGKLMLKSKSLLTAYGVIRGEEVELVDPKEKGWFVSEDRAEIEGNILRILGRVGDIVKIGGENVALSSLEKVAESIKLELNLTQDLALVALPDERLGKAIHLVTTHESLRLVTFVEEFQNRVLPFEKIRGIHFLPKIPRNELGKLKRKELSDFLACK